MPEPLNRETKVKTNLTKNSIMKIAVNILEFKQLWSSYPQEKIVHMNPETNTDLYADHCAINVSHALKLSGVAMKSVPKEQQCNRYRCPNTDSNGRGIHVRLAQDLADYLKKQPFAGCPKVEVYKGTDYPQVLKGRTGIVFFKDYWQREGQTGNSRTGDHIDLWNDDVLAGEGSVQSFFTVTLGLSLDGVYSDHKLSKEIWFWDIK